MITQDARYAVRSLLRAPGFTLVALITLALGIGGTTAIYSVVDGILLRPLPYPDSSHIVLVWRSTPNGGGGTFAAADYLDYKRRSQSFRALAGFRQDSVDLTGRGEPVRLTALETSAGFFDVFAMPPLAGRAYTEAMDSPAGPRVTVISESLWDQQFGRSADTVGSVIRLNGVPMQIIGIMPRAFAHPGRVDLWVLSPREVPTSPLAIEGDVLANRDVQYFNVVGKLRADVALEQAGGELRAIGAAIAQEHPATNEGEYAAAEPLQEALVEDVRTAVLVLFGAVGFVLLIACANVASLLLARGTGRRRELAVRSALGAARLRLVRQLLVESVVLAAGGGVLGLIVAYWGIDLLLAIAPDSIPRIEEVTLDARVAAFATGATTLIGILFGIAPAIQGARTQVVEALKEGGRAGTTRTGGRSALVVAEIALSLVLLIAAGLMLTSFNRLRGVNLGFVAENLVIVGVALPQARYGREAQISFYQQLYERLTIGIQDQPGTRAALAFPSPFSGANSAASYEIDGRPARSRQERSVAQLSAVSPGYFQTMGIPVLKGRDLSFSDSSKGPNVAIINRLMAEREWPNEDPVGQRLILGGDRDDPDSRITVVGVVADSKRQDLQAETEPTAYLPLTQFTLPFMSVVIRTTAGAAGAANAVRTAVRSLDPDLPLEDVESIEHVLGRATGQPRFRATLVAAFAAAALLLAAIGLYGLISYTVAQRIPEIGVRLALGATPAQVLRLVVAQAMRLSLIGVAFGLAGAVAVGRVIRGLLFSISATDPIVYASLALFLLTIAAFACYVPARRAMRVDPMTALRAE